MDFTTPFKPGVDPISRAVAAGAQKLEDAVMKADALIATATNATDSLVDNLTDLADKTKAMIPELPSFPALNLQAEITSLVALAPASGAYAAKLKLIGDKFGSAISDAGLDLTKIASDGASALAGATGSLTATIPNMEFPADLIPGVDKAITIAKESLFPLATKLTEEVLPTFTDGPATEALAESAAAAAEEAKNALKNFGSESKRLAEELKNVQIQKRLDEAIRSFSA